MRFLIVGSGLFGSVCARELTDAGHICHVIDKRNHIGGNCYTLAIPEAGCHEHVYGPHIFHTNSKRIWHYINRFSEFNSFVYRPKAYHSSRYYSFPINLMTLYQMWGVTSPKEAAQKLSQVRVPINDPSNLEEWCLSQIGAELYNTFVRGYTAKQWNANPCDLPASIIKRIPIRLNFDDNYFVDQYQGIPIEGYTPIFKRLLAGIPTELGVNFLNDRDYWINRFDKVIYTGTLDSFFDYSEGMLRYRSLRFERELMETSDFQGVAVINYTDFSIPYTRVVEHKHFHMKFDSAKTLITKEYPIDWKIGDDEYYPIETPVNRITHSKYQLLLKDLCGKLIPGGRLGEYRYYDMHQVIASALKLVDKICSQ